MAHHWSLSGAIKFSVPDILHHFTSNIMGPEPTVMMTSASSFDHSHIDDDDYHGDEDDDDDDPLFLEADK